MVAPESVWRERLLGYIDEHAAEIVADLVDLVQIPSVRARTKRTRYSTSLLPALRSRDCGNLAVL